MHTLQLTPNDPEREPNCQYNLSHSQCDNTVASGYLINPRQRKCDHVYLMKVLTRTDTG